MRSDMQLHFRLYNACFPVKGAEMGLICDVQRKEAFHIPNLLVEVLEKACDHSVESIKDQYHHQYDEGIDAYLGELAKLGIGFFTSQPEAFPAMDLTWESPLEVYSAILEIESAGNYDVADVLRQLDRLGCAGLQLRFLMPFSTREIADLLGPAKNSRLKFIELYIADNGEAVENLFRLAEGNRRIVSLVVHSSKKAGLVASEKPGEPLQVVFTDQVIGRGQPDLVRPEDFVASISIITEAMQFNIGLNRKISVDADGFIRNYVSHETNFGHVSRVKIQDVARSAGFQEKWLLHNDRIEKCRDCQYRYLCLSNSDIVEADGKYYKKDTCRFDPYANIWR